MTPRIPSQTASSGNVLDKFQNQGLIAGSDPVAVIDIGSNSVRLVMYEHLSRSPVPMYNEKVLCGLGKGVAVTGQLDEGAVSCALRALERFSFLLKQAGVEQFFILATAAAREASNGAAFLKQVKKICGQEAEVLSGEEEARHSALGVVSAMMAPNGVAGDLGGGSLELIRVMGDELGKGATYPLGGLRLSDMAKGSIKQAQKIARAELEKATELNALEGQNFYAIGGTWRALARLHMSSIGYPLAVMHHYEIDPDEMLEFCELTMRGDIEDAGWIGSISKARRALIPFGAAVLAEVIKRGKPRKIIMSALGVREGHLYGLLPDDVKQQDPLLSACEELCVLRARSPEYAHELADWLDLLFARLEVDESAYEKRLRRASCLLADIGWRAHPDYRGTQSLNIIAHGTFIGIDHPGRAYLAMANYFRHEGLSGQSMGLSMRDVANVHMRSLARLTGAALRLAHVAAGDLPSILPHLDIAREGDVAILKLPEHLKVLQSEKLSRRFTQFTRLLGLEGRVE
ncbi:MAG: Ppx/GppA family phosphatase [Cohaesibacter sp.]|jgi:exopolyphosphatase/guanosine-5'-triphosphate,3'-diphosphate pyrophosphatase|nr:Ppx/GppA family phosphatase [Cohaesibacter sp.]